MDDPRSAIDQACDPCGVYPPPFSPHSVRAIKEPTRRPSGPLAGGVGAFPIPREPAVPLVAPRGIDRPEQGELIPPGFLRCKEFPKGGRSFNSDLPQAEAGAGFVVFHALRREPLRRTPSGAHGRNREEQPIRRGIGFYIIAAWFS